MIGLLVCGRCLFDMCVCACVCRKFDPQTQNIFNHQMTLVHHKSSSKWFLCLALCPVCVPCSFVAYSSAEGYPQNGGRHLLHIREEIYSHIYVIFNIVFTFLSVSRQSNAYGVLRVENCISIKLHSFLLPTPLLSSCTFT